MEPYVAVVLLLRRDCRDRSRRSDEWIVAQAGERAARHGAEKRVASYERFENRRSDAERGAELLKDLFFRQHASQELE